MGWISKESYLLEVRKCKVKMRTAKIQAELDLAKEINTNYKRFYSHINERNKTRKEEVGPLSTEEGMEIKDNLGMAQHLNKYFASVFNKGNEELGVVARWLMGMRRQK